MLLEFFTFIFYSVNDAHKLWTLAPKQLTFVLRLSRLAPRRSTVYSYVDGRRSRPSGRRRPVDNWHTQLASWTLPWVLYSFCATSEITGDRLPQSIPNPRCSNLDNLACPSDRSEFIFKLNKTKGPHSRVAIWLILNVEVCDWCGYEVRCLWDILTHLWTRKCLA